MKRAPWFADDWRERYAKLLHEMQLLERLAKIAGRNIRPANVKSDTPQRREGA